MIDLGRGVVNDCKNASCSWRGTRVVFFDNRFDRIDEWRLVIIDCEPEDDIKIMIFFLSTYSIITTFFLSIESKKT